MRRPKHSERAVATLAGYQYGADAALGAIRCGMTRAEAARAIILVEGISDQIALETLARRQGRDLAEEGVVVFPTGGCGGLSRYLAQFMRVSTRPLLAGLCDQDAAGLLRNALRGAGLPAPADDDRLAEQGFHICRKDLEDELIRALGPEGIVGIIEAEGEGGALATLQKQAGWQGCPVEAQLHRFLRSKASRSLRYARLLVEAAADERMPAPLVAVLAAV